MDIGRSNGSVAPLTRKIAVAVYQDRISSRLDCSENILLLTFVQGKIVGRQQMRLLYSDPMDRIRLLVREEVQLVICGGITRTYASMLHDANIEVIPWVQGRVDEVLREFVAGTLQRPTSRRHHEIPATKLTMDHRHNEYRG
jgi:predicted Fe-Mo cluster-binding NifX family protein